MVTITSPPSGGTPGGSAGGALAGSYPNPSIQAMFQGRMQRDSATQISLQRYTGDIVEVAGSNVSLGSGGIACLTTDTLIDGTGLPVLTTDTTDNTAGGDFNNTTDPISIAAASYPNVPTTVGSYIKVESEILKVSAFGGGNITLARAQLGTSAAAHANGIDIFKESAAAASTLYYVYVSNGSATIYASDLRLSTTSPTAVSGVKYLSGSGNGLNWRFVGWVRTNGSTQFTDSATSRCVVNYYNRIRKQMLLNPDYNDNNADTTFAVTSATFAQVGATPVVGDFISNGEDAAIFCLTAQGVAGSGGDVVVAGIGIDGTTAVVRACIMPGTVVNGASCTHIDVHSEGRHTVEISAWKSGGGGASLYMDIARAGAASDPRTTYIEGYVTV